MALKPFDRFPRPATVTEVSSPIHEAAKPASVEVALAILPRRESLVALWLHTSIDPHPEEWTRANERIEEQLTAHKLTPRHLRGLVVTDGGSPDALQRRTLAQSFPGIGPQSVVTTVLSNPIKRGVATALHWVNPQMRFFTPHEMQDALVHAKLMADVDLVWDSLVLMQSELRTRVHALAMAAEVLGRPLGPSSRPESGSSY